MYFVFFDFQILSKADNNTVMEAVDPEVSVTCMDLGHVRKTFQLALLCTKSHPSERPTMHEVARVLVSLLPPPPAKTSTAPTPKGIDYTQFVIGKGQHQLKSQQEQNLNSHMTTITLILSGMLGSVNLCQRIPFEDPLLPLNLF